MKKATILGIPVNIATEEECERASFVVCGPTSYFDDDIHAQCAFCRAPIVHRPYAPKTPTKICIECMKRTLGKKES
jgi:hypothetical protein